MLHSFEDVQAAIRTGSIVVSDSEYLNENLGKFAGRPTEEHWKEIVQIAAVRYTKGQAVATFNQFVLPSVMGDKMTAEQWRDFERITQFTRDEIYSNGRSFEEVFAEFQRFIGQDSLVVIHGDAKVYKVLTVFHSLITEHWLMLV